MIYNKIFEKIGLSVQISQVVEMLVITALVFLLTVVLTHKILPVLKAKKMGQNISVYIEEHKSKQGTPTMGGICIIIALLVVMLFWFILEACGFMGHKNNSLLIKAALTLCLGVCNGMVGFVDDYAKLVKKQNEGLTPIQKSALQMFVACAYLAVMGMSGNLNLSLRIPFTDYSLYLGWFAYPVYLLFIVGFVNSTNITDGIDGLASSIAASVAGCIMLISSVYLDRYTGVIGAALLGSTLGFLVFNHYPAKIFMGDTGSLFLGGIIMGCAVSTGETISFMLMSLVFILEMLSSLTQTLYFKLTHGKRLFKKAPVHHHFQMLGWSEVKIVSVFFLVSIIFCTIGYLGIVLH